MAMTVKEVMGRYKGRFGNRNMVLDYKEHQKFLEDLARVSGERWMGQPYPPDIDAATELSDEESARWLWRMDNLPGCM